MVLLSVFVENERLVHERGRDKVFRAARGSVGRCSCWRRGVLHPEEEEGQRREREGGR